MPEAEIRARVVSEAMTWIGTPYQDGAKVRGAGVDCAQFVAAVYEAAGVIPAQDIKTYPAQWFLHRDQERFLPYVERVGVEIEAAACRPGDLVLYRIGRAFAHGAIVVAWPDRIIHAHALSRAVVLSRADEADLRGRPTRTFRLIPADA